MGPDKTPTNSSFLYDEIMKQRSNPAVVIIDGQDRLLYFNQEAQEFLGLNSGEPSGPAKVPPEINDLCGRLKTPVRSEARISGLIRDASGRSHIASAHFIRPSGSQDDFNFIVVIQPVAESHIDFKKVRERYDLTPREIEVLGLVCAGYSNREISEKLFISEYTAQDHLKNIMRKMGVSSRSKLVALVI